MKLRRLKRNVIARMMPSIRLNTRWCSDSPVNFDSVKETLQAITSIAGGLPSFWAGLALGDLHSMIPEMTTT